MRIDSVWRSCFENKSVPGPFNLATLILPPISVRITSMMNGGALGSAPRRPARHMSAVEGEPPQFATNLLRELDEREDRELERELDDEGDRDRRGEGDLLSRSQTW